MKTIIVRQHLRKGRVVRQHSRRTSTNTNARHVLRKTESTLGSKRYPKTGKYREAIMIAEHGEFQKSHDVFGQRPNKLSKKTQKLRQHSRRYGAAYNVKHILGTGDNYNRDYVARRKNKNLADKATKRYGKGKPKIQALRKALKHHDRDNRFKKSHNSKGYKK